MKTAALALIIIAAFLVSCNKTEHLLTLKDGEWNIDKETITITVDTFPPSVNVLTNPAVVTFYDDYTGTLTYYDGNPDDNFTWELQGENSIVITYTDTLVDPVAFDIIENTKDNQHWNSMVTDALSGPVTTTEIDLEMSSMH